MLKIKYVILVLGLLLSCKKQSRSYDFVAFARHYTGNYGISRIIQRATYQLQNQRNPYHGIFLRSSSSDVERMLIYDLISRNDANVMFFLPDDFSEIFGLALRYPEQKFVFPYTPDLSRNKLPRNLRMATVRIEEGAFLAGIIAGKMTRNNHVGMLLDLNDQNTEAVRYAFVQGVRTVNSDCDILIVRTQSNESMLENETTRMISTDNIDTLFAMSANYNNTIIRSAYYFGNDVLLINSWYNADNRWPRHVIASFILSLGPIVQDFMENAQSMASFSSLPPIRVYNSASKNVMRLSWEGQEHTTFEMERSEYRDMSRETRKITDRWTQRIRKDRFVVFNTLEHGVPPAELQNFRYRDVRNFRAMEDQ